MGYKYSKYGKRAGLSKRMVAVTILLVLLVVMAGLELTGVTHIFHKQTPAVVSGGSFNTKGEPKTTKTGSATQNGSSVSASSANGSNNKPAGPALALITPSGDFVSNHHPNLSGSPAPNALSSVCNSTPGASCQITFTMDGVVKSLPARTADSDGSVFWDWKLQDIGLTVGSWNIQAIASLNGQTKTASDSLDLVVSQ